MALETCLASASVADALDRVLDKGIVVDAFLRVSVLGLEVVALELRAVVGSIDTWLNYAQAVGLATPQPVPAEA